MNITQAILPVAGLGTRFLPLTKVVPKELLPLGNKPIIAHLVDECLEVGITDICFVINPGKESIPSYFAPHPELEAALQKKGKLDALNELKKYDNVKFTVKYQHEQHGDGHALLQARDWATDPVVAVLFGDDLIHDARSGLKQLMDAYATRSHDAKNPGVLLALENVPREKVSKYGIVEIAETTGNIHRIKGLVEKPKPEDAPSTLGIIGKYLVPKSIFDVLHEVEGADGSEIRLIDAMIHRIKHVPIYGVEMQGKRLDTGTPEGYKEAVRVLG
jgi:UTP--glucose-1-phosphate uridylyltransferase